MSAQSEVNAFVKQHDGHTFDMTAGPRVVVVTCCDCATGIAAGAATEAERENAFEAHYNRIARAMMEVEVAHA
jgi:hypothetical protein